MKNDVGVFRVAIGAIILNDKKECLITQRSLERDHHPGEWETIYGRMDQGESFEDAIHREVKEEIGITVEVIAPINTFHFYRGEEKVEHVGVSFLCRHKSGEVKVDGVEEVDFKWVSLEEAREIVKDESIKRDFIAAEKFLNK
jgi:8-oxo-dGTP diphosphatase